ncbi:hypothetical protein [Pelagibaculum spongiae]|uniref:Uncharacterized protein n=1 Tax=Pelagibaculum spongiae TaxID=2080658 RepID=A0A2V1GNW0_9GAMM|nr:hypothetical protein [Pelagibaculum spongiae]PVZ63910.1 hypothetical protein DC094_20530 [Pelagibaculum spongiae]
MKPLLNYTGLLISIWMGIGTANAQIEPKDLTSAQNQAFFGQTSTPSWLLPTIDSTNLLRQIYGLLDIQGIGVKSSDENVIGPYLGKGVRGQCGEAIRASHQGFTYQPINQESVGDQYNWQAGTEACALAFFNNTLLLGVNGFLPQGRAYIQKPNFSALLDSREDENGVTQTYSPPQPVLTIGNSDFIEAPGNHAALNLPVDDGIAFFRDNAVMLYAHPGESSQRIAPFLQQHATLDLELLEIFYSGSTSQQITSNNNRARLKNALIAGVVCLNGTASFNDDNYCQSNFGPTPEGRIKPDLVLGDAAHLSVSHLGGQRLDRLGGFNSSAFQLFGLAGLVNQMYADGIFTGNPGRLGDLSSMTESEAASLVYRHRPSPAMTRALLVNSAYRYPVAQIGRYNQGWGIPQLSELAKRATENGGKFTLVTDRQALIHQQTHSQILYVEQSPSSGKLEVTMAFQDPEDDAYTATNNLSLKVTSPSGSVYWGNQGLLAGDASVSGSNEDRVNTIEHVLINTPEDGGWTVEVIASSITVDGVKETTAVDNQFALVASCSANSPEAYNFCSDTREEVPIEVEDPLIPTPTAEIPQLTPEAPIESQQTGGGTNSWWAVLALFTILLFYRLLPQIRNNKQ